MTHSYKALLAALLLASLPLLACSALAATEANPAPTPTPAPLHEIGTSDPAATPAVAPPPAQRKGDLFVRQTDDDQNRVAVNDQVDVTLDETVPGNAVSVMGPLKVEGTVEGNAVDVMGSSTIDGTVRGNAVIVLGSLHLGPHAHVDGNAVAVGGIITKAPGAFVGGNVFTKSTGIDLSEDSGVYSWWNHGFRRGRPLAFGPHLHVFWILSICTVALYVLLALMFPNGVTKCGDLIAQKPGITILTGILAIISLPVVFLLLLITVVGIPIAFVVLPIAVIAFMLFGKAAVYALIGRSIMRNAHPALATLVGALLLVCFYLVPILGGLLWIVIGFLGYSCAVSALFTGRKAPAAPVPPAAPPLVAPAAAEVAAPVAAEAAAGAAAVATAPVPPAPPPVAGVHEAALPKAGFWVRMVAILIDFLLVMLVTQGKDWFPVALAAYCAILWKLRGATVGDIIFGIKVVRVDGAQMEWVTTIVRALACFFSAIAVGLGFIWIAFDADKQGWHDKIAGTVVVKVPKGVTLV